MTKLYGVRHAGIFSPLLQIIDGGFIYKRKNYKWEDIVALKCDHELPMLARYPSTTILLSDATMLRIPAIIEEKGKYEGLKFHPLCSKNKAYEELISLIKSNKGRIKSPFDDKLISYNYIMLYRFLIFIGFFTLPIIYFLYIMHEVNIEIIIIPVVFSLGLISGIALLFRRIKLEKQIRTQLVHHKISGTD